MARAVRDHLADCLSTLPALAEEGEEAPIHFFIGNLTNMRKEIFPGLELAYSDWLKGGGVEPLLAISEAGRAHWGRIARQMIELHRGSGGKAAKSIEDLVGVSYL
jgi:hypothetical protein